MAVYFPHGGCPRFGASVLLKRSLRLNAGIIKLAEFCKEGLPF
jgi:hypothetical protein